MRYIFCGILVAGLLVSCNHLIQGNDLSAADIKRIGALGILDKDEQVIKFYSEYKKSYAGNFFTEKRIAMYWIDSRDSTKNVIKTAFYKDIKSMDTVYNAGLTYSPYILVTMNNGSSFKVSVGGGRKEFKLFYMDVLKSWKGNQRVL
ncbi:hypothetical protein [Chitinophaga sp. Cy-1792]|uniref:hypothetical protein n=1 Tax=Chitinophaga sp. Cy-1792 TaxID=2608339 RepID=UPI0014208BA9|nr:hypothetical protein [Chitinophaga sp. Cy-1792]NIG53539.1 hypothetical protein [Chitinophaga sp. Cy-1792]